MSDIQWIKLSTDVFNNRKIKQIENMPDGDALIVIWFKLLVLAGETNDNGMVYFTKDIPYTDDLLANQFGKPLKTIQFALETFRRFGMIDIVNNILCITNWQKYQNVDGMERVREQTRERVANYRERQKALMASSRDGNVTGNVTVTDGNETDKEEDKEKEGEDITDSFADDVEFINSLSSQRQKKEQKKPRVNEMDAVLDSYELSQKMRDVLVGYIEMRKKKKNGKGFTPRALKLAINQLLKFAGDEDKRIAIVEQTIMHGWDAFYELKDNNKSWGNVQTNKPYAVNNGGSEWSGLGTL